MKTLDADAIVARTAPAVHQQPSEIQPFGHLVRMPIALSDTACREAVENLNQSSRIPSRCATSTRNIIGKYLARPSTSSTCCSTSIATNKTIIRLQCHRTATGRRSPFSLASPTSETLQNISSGRPHGSFLPCHIRVLPSVDTDGVRPRIRIHWSTASSITSGSVSHRPEDVRQAVGLGQDALQSRGPKKILLTIVVSTNNIAGVARSFAQQITQTRPFASPEQEAMLAVRRTAASLLGPWEKFLKTQFSLSTGLFNVLRILRGSHPTALTCGEIGARTIARDPDITRLVDQLRARGLVTRARSRKDRRVVEVSITSQGTGSPA